MSGFRHARRAVLVLTPVVSLLLLLAGAFVFSGSGALAASHSRTLYVGHIVGTNSGCGSPGYTMVQAAVDAAHDGDTVYLCGTTPFTEQVIITKEITLTGDKGATIQAPSVFTTTLSQLPAQFARDGLFVPQAIVIVWGNKSNVRITNLNITGPLPGGLGCGNDEYGILVIADGKATIKNDHVTNIHDSDPTLYGCQFGVGIQIGREYWPTSNFGTYLVENFKGTATIQNTVVTGYQKNGMTIDGPHSWADVKNNSVQGAGRDPLFGAMIAQNGIQISRGAYAEVDYNYVAGNSYTGINSASSSGIIVFGGCGDPLVIGIEVKHNTLINNDVGIYLNNYSADPNCTAPPSQKTKDVAEYNSIFNDAVTNVGPVTVTQGLFPGYQAGIDDVGNYDTIDHNTIGGPGYTPSNTTDMSKAFVIPIDTISFPTIHPRVYDNKIL